MALRRGWRVAVLPAAVGRLPSMLAEQPGRGEWHERSPRLAARWSPKPLRTWTGNGVMRAAPIHFHPGELPLSSHPPPGHPAEPARQSTASGRRDRGRATAGGSAASCGGTRQVRGRDGDVGAYAGDARGRGARLRCADRRAPLLPRLLPAGSRLRVRAQCEKGSASWHPVQDHPRPARRCVHLEGRVQSAGALATLAAADCRECATPPSRKLSRRAGLLGRAHTIRARRRNKNVCLQHVEQAKKIDG